MILKYILLIIIIYLVLTYIPALKLDNRKIIQIIVIAVVGLWIFENLVMKKREGMDQVGLTYPDKYIFKSPQEDYIQSGLKYDYNQPQHPLLQCGQFEKGFMPFNEVKKELEEQRYNKPGYYLSNDGEYAENGIPYDKVGELIEKSKLNDLWNQHNHHIYWSPHTHVGKERGRMNWEKVMF